ncbi:hypothetical protein ACSBR1_018097 [Camellia fascicularis]
MARLLMDQAQAQLKDEPFDDEPPALAQKSSSSSSSNSTAQSTSFDPYAAHFQNAQDPYA